jgi:hypothetical protein
MQKRSAGLLAVVLGATGALVLAGAGPAWAHEERVVGKYHFAVGFGSEPAYTGQENSVQLLLKDLKDNPVSALGDTLRVEVAYGATDKLSLSLVPFFEVGEFGIPGDYRAWFFPTQSGNYTFLFTGSIKGQTVEESFTSSDTTFSPVRDPTGVQFPAKEPSIGELAARLSREVPRLQAQVAAARSAAEHRADSARTVGFVGVAVGLVGILVAAAALVAARRRSGGSAPIGVGGR